MAGRRRSYSGALAGVRTYTEEQARRRQDQRHAQQQDILAQRQFQRQRTLQSERLTTEQGAKRQAFEERLRQALLTAGVREGQLLVDPTGQTRSNPAYGQPAAAVPGRLPTPTVQPPPMPGRAPMAPKFLSDAQTAAMLGEAQPGQPLPAMRQDPRTFQPVSNIPFSDAGRNTMNRAIYSGLTESPAAQRLAIPPPMVPPASPGLAPAQAPNLLERMRNALGPLLSARPQLPVVAQAAPAQTAPSPATTPSDLPDPRRYWEGVVIEDNQTGQRYRLRGGQWVPE